jgi:hypothetical protein
LIAADNGGFCKDFMTSTSLRMPAENGKKSDKFAHVLSSLLLHSLHQGKWANIHRHNSAHTRSQTKIPSLFHALRHLFLFPLRRKSGISHGCLFTCSGNFSATLDMASLRDFSIGLHF